MLYCWHRKPEASKSFSSETVVIKVEWKCRLLSREIRCDALESMKKVFISEAAKKVPKRDWEQKIFIRMIAESSPFDAVLQKSFRGKRALKWRKLALKSSSLGGCCDKSLSQALTRYTYGFGGYIRQQLHLSLESSGASTLWFGKLDTFPNFWLNRNGLDTPKDCKHSTWLTLCCCVVITLSFLANLKIQNPKACLP